MRISRLYVTGALNSGTTLELNETSAHYVRSVLRLSKGSKLVLFNGGGIDYSAVLSLVSRRSVCAQIEDGQARNCESPLKISLGLGISRGERMDLAIQKSVELGVNRVIPLITERCVVKFSDKERSEQKRLHWQKIAQHACEQCGRSTLPSVAQPLSLSGWLSNATGFKFLLDPNAETSLKQLSPDDPEICILSGPEGGFSPAERETAARAGFATVRMGPRILRTETAALTAVAVAQALWGDLV